MSQGNELMMQLLDLVTLGESQVGVKYSSDLLRKIGEKVDPYMLVVRPALVDEKYDIELYKFDKCNLVRADLMYVLQEFSRVYQAFIKKEGGKLGLIKVNYKRCGINLCDEAGEVLKMLGFETRIDELNT